ncbi:MAG: Uma2 family endonuclease [Magnetococcus sp. YQC-5]
MSSMPDAGSRLVTVEAFLNRDDPDDLRCELLQGRVVAMAPPSPLHGKLVARLAVVLQRQLQAPCAVVVEAGIRVQEPADTFFQADLAVSCTPFGREARFLPDPVVIVEVLSPASQSHDRGNKVAGYRFLPSVREILLLSSTAWHVEWWHRTVEGWLVMDWIGRDIRLLLESIGTGFTLAEIYQDMALEIG